MDRPVPIMNSTDDRLAGFILFRVNNGIVEYLLLLKKKKNPNERDDWSPPKGHIDLLDWNSPEKGYEVPLDAAKREMLEETGLVAEDYTIFHESSYALMYITRLGIPKKVDLWPVKLKNGDHEIKIESNEHTEFRWVNYQDTLTIVKKQYKQAFVDMNVYIESVKNN